MAKTPRQYITELLIKFGRMFQLPEPPAEYVDSIYNALHTQNWTLKEFATVLNQLVTDGKYTEQSARFGKYPMISDYLRLKKQKNSAEFYEALSAYLSGAYWEKEHIAAIATPEQRNAITMAGGLENLYARATGDMPTPVYKLVNMVAENESDTQTDLIDTDHRIGAPTTLKRIGLTAESPRK